MMHRDRESNRKIAAVLGMMTLMKSDMEVAG